MGSRVVGNPGAEEAASILAPPVPVILTVLD